MAATRLIALHIRSGKNRKQCLKDSINYILNPEKNEKGEYVKKTVKATLEAKTENLTQNN